MSELLVALRSDWTLGQSGGNGWRNVRDNLQRATRPSMAWGWQDV
jgi:hypothetical protein